MPFAQQLALRIGTPLAGRPTSEARATGGRRRSPTPKDEALPAILKDVEDDLRRGIEDAAPGWGVTIHVSAKVSGIERAGGAFSVAAEIGGKRERLEADVVLLATGRGPRVDGLDLEKVGVVVEKKGIRANEYLETDTPGIYAAGDVRGRFQLSPVADYEGRLAARNALKGNHEKAQG